MFRLGRQLLALALVLSPAALAVPAGALPLPHTWVSSSGSDSSSSCDISAPCKTFLAAYNNTAAGGEITCLNSGDFANSSEGLTIVKSITINCEGTLGSPDTVAGSILLQFVIVQTSPGDVVVLRGLDFDAMGEGTCGGSGGGVLGFMGAGTLHVQKSKINHVADGCDGIWVNATGPTEIDISDCDITDNGTSGTGGGIYILPNSGVTANISIDRSHINNNYYGIFADGRSGGIIRDTISDSVVSGNTENGVTAVSSGASVVLIIDQTKIAGNNAAGLVASGSNAALLARNSSVFGNAIGLRPVSGGAIYSYGTNSVAGNPTEGSFTGAVGLQ